MFQFTDPTPATLTSVTPRTEVHGDDRVFAISLGIKITGPNTLLDKLSPTIRHALYKSLPGQEQLPGIEAITPVLRSRVIEEVKIGPSNLEGWTLAVDHGIDEQDPIKIGSCKVDKFRCVPKEGGSIELMFRVGSNDISATEAGLLCSHLSQEISLTLIAPERPERPKEASESDQPDAGDLFAAEHGDPGDGTDSEGGETDVDDDETSGETEAATVEQSQPGTRTARGREKTKAALAAGAAAAQGATPEGAAG